MAENSYRRRQNTQISGGVDPQPLVYTPIAEKLSGTFGKTIESLNEASEKVGEQEQLVNDAFGKYIVHESEKPYVDKLKKQVHKELSADPFNVRKARELAGKYASDPGLISRSKYYAQMQQAKEKIDARVSAGKISADTAEWFLDEKRGPGRYNYQEGKEYTTQLPFDDIKWNELFEEAKRNVGVNSRQSDVVRGSHTDGSGTTTRQGSSYAGMTPERIQSYVQKLLDMPQFRGQIGQEVEVLESKKARLESKLRNTTDEITRRSLARQIQDIERTLSTYDPTTLESYVTSRLLSSHGLQDEIAFSQTSTTDHSESTTVTKDLLSPTVPGAGGGVGGLFGGYGGNSGNQPTSGKTFEISQNGLGLKVNKTLSGGAYSLFSQNAGAGGNWK